MMRLIKYAIALSALAFAAAASAGSTWTSDTTTPYRSSLVVSTTGAESCPTSASSGINLPAGKALVVTAIAHLIPNMQDAGLDAAIYDPTGAGDGGADAATNTFFGGSLYACVYDTVSATWNRYPAGDIPVDTGGTRFTATAPALPAGPVAYVPSGTGVPVKIYLSIR